MKGIILTLCFIIELIIIFRGEELINKVNFKEMALLVFTFSIIITILLFYVF